MSDCFISFSPVDTWMFRDGRPFGQDDPGAAVATSVFPPYPPTVAGAIRAALWRTALDGKWDPARLGDGVHWQEGDSLGPLSFGPLAVIHDGQPVFPVPLHIVEGKGRQKGQKILTRLTPGKPMNCDLGDKVRLPRPMAKDLQGIKTITDHWVTAKGMQQILEGSVPDQETLIPLGSIWRTEPRVGIGIDRESRITSNAQLYMASHVRLKKGNSLSVRMKGWDGELDETLTSLAGEHRMAVMAKGAESWKMPAGLSSADDLYCLIAISPVAPDENGVISGLQDRQIISACTGKPVDIGGWDSLNKRAIPLRRCWPAGSVWFIKSADPPSSIGEANDWGFGHVLAGKWTDEEGEESQS